VEACICNQAPPYPSLLKTYDTERRKIA
jgi:phenol 2-monooxygenase (NADPH)